jgi:Asp-tRNA(Asn)/Glu-tRNA(Gln) amidotransferase A subunit family amidase
MESGEIAGRANLNTGESGNRPCHTCVGVGTHPKRRIPHERNVPYVPSLHHPGIFTHKSPQQGHAGKAMEQTESKTRSVNCAATPKYDEAWCLDDPRRLLVPSEEPDG